MKHLLSVLLALLSVQPAFAEDDRVQMSLEEFLELYDTVHKTKPASKPQAPTAYTRSAIRYEGTVEVDESGQPVSVVFDASMRIEPLRDGWIKGHFLSREAALMSATIDGRTAPVMVDGAWYAVPTDRDKPFDLDLRFAVPILRTDGLPGFSMPLVPGGSTTIELVMPDSQSRDITIARAHRMKQTVRGGRTVVEAALAAGDRLAVRWQPKAAETSTEARMARVQAESFNLIGFGDGVLHARSTIAHTIRFAGVDRFRYRVPEGMTVLDVRGVGIDEWTMGSDQVLTVDLNFMAEDAWQISVDMEKVIGSSNQSLDAPWLTPLDLDRTKGWVGITAGGHLEITPGEASGAGAVDVRALPPNLLGLTQQPVLLGYKFLDAGARIPLTLSSHEQVDVLVTLIDRTNATTTVTVGGRRLTRVVYDIRNHHKQFLRLTLPPGASLWSAAVAGRAVQPSKAEGGALLMPLARSSSGTRGLASFPVEVVYVETGDPLTGAARFEAELPRPDVPSTVVSWSVYVPSDGRVPKRSVEGELRKVHWVRDHATTEYIEVGNEQQQMQRGAVADAAAGGLGNAAAPVKVELPLDGTAYNFEKLLALDERLWVGFDIRGIR